MTYVTIDQAFDALSDMVDDVRADFGEEAVDGAYADLVSSVALDCTSKVRAELMRRTGVNR